nr:hypothetical protein [Tanacetum cinerariifolium]
MKVTRALGIMMHSAAKSDVAFALVVLDPATTVQRVREMQEKDIFSARLNNKQFQTTTQSVDLATSKYSCLIRYLHPHGEQSSHLISLTMMMIFTSIFPSLLVRDLYALGDDRELHVFKNLAQEDFSWKKDVARAPKSCCRSSNECFLTKCGQRLLLVIVAHFGESIEIPFIRHIVDGRDQPIITCLEYTREYLMKMIVVVHKVIAKTVGPLTSSVTAVFDAIKKATDIRVSSCRKWELTRIPCKHVVAAIYNMSENSMGVEYHVNMILTVPPPFDANLRTASTAAKPCQGDSSEFYLITGRILTVAAADQREKVRCRDGSLPILVESTTFIIPPNYKPKVGRLPKKRTKSYDEIPSESCSSSKLSRKGKSVKCSKCGNLGHNRKGCRGQGGAIQVGGSSQAGARQAVGARNVSGQDGARNVSGQAAGARNSSSQASGSSQPRAAPSTLTGVRNVSSQADNKSRTNSTECRT